MTKVNDLVAIGGTKSAAKQYWCVRQRFYATGTVLVQVYSVCANTIPSNSHTGKDDFAEYCNYYLTLKEAQAFAQVIFEL